MKWLAMLSCEPQSLRDHYRGVRELAYNNARIAQSCRNRRTIARLAHQMEFLMTQISMCENAARKREIALVVREAVS